MRACRITLPLLLVLASVLIISCATADLANWREAVPDSPSGGEASASKPEPGQDASEPKLGAPPNPGRSPVPYRPALEPIPGRGTPKASSQETNAPTPLSIESISIPKEGCIVDGFLILEVVDLHGQKFTPFVIDRDGDNVLLERKICAVRSYAKIFSYTPPPPPTPTPTRILPPTPFPPDDRTSWDVSMDIRARWDIDFRGGSRKAVLAAWYAGLEAEKNGWSTEEIQKEVDYVSRAVDRNEPVVPRNERTPTPIPTKTLTCAQKYRDEIKSDRSYIRCYQWVTKEAEVQATRAHSKRMTLKRKERVRATQEASFRGVREKHLRVSIAVDLVSDRAPLEHVPIGYERVGFSTDWLDDMKAIPLYWSEWREVNELREMDELAELYASPPEERAALVALYSSTDGENWIDNTNWLSDRPLGEWYGVKTGLRNNVISLVLDRNNLRGKIPSEFGDLAHIQVLSLRENHLDGKIPPELGNLKRLRKLYLSKNRLSGEIPSELGGMNNLRELSLGMNPLSGEIPPELGNLFRLTDLFLSHTLLSGTIPPELGNLAKLVVLSLHGTSLSGDIPTELGKLHSLRLLSLRDTQLTGCIPKPLEFKLHPQYRSMRFCDE